MIVILAEKSSAAHNFAKALGGMSGSYQGESYKIVHAVGHVYAYPKKVSSLVPDGKKEKYDTWDVGNLPWDPDDFTWKIEPDKSKAQAIQNIQDALKAASEVCIATDNDSTGEGDLLAWEILLALKWRGKTTRMIFNDEKEKSVRDAFNKRFEIPDPEQYGPFVKARARSKFDYLSMQFTRMATLMAKERGHRAVLRQGRLKSVMVYLVGKQLEDIKNYVKVPFYEVRFKDENGNVFKCKEEKAERFTDKSSVNIDDFGASEVVLDKTEMRGTRPGDLLDLAGLASVLSEKGYNPDEVLETYQKMYEDHIVSYPRTDDKKITPAQFEELRDNREKIANVVGVDPSLLTHIKLRDKHVIESATHGANRPDTNIPSSLDELLSYGPSGPAIYEILAKNALAIFGEDYIYERQTGHLKDYPGFIGSSNIPKKMGYKLIFDSGKDDEDEDETSKGLGKIGSPYIHEGSNPKPKTPTMKWLVGKNGQLEKYNVGTGATRTSTFKDIIDDKGKNKDMQLVKMTKKGVLSMTEIGEYSYILLKGCNIASPEVTEKLLKNMDEVGEFTKNQEEIVHSITPLMLHDMEVMKSNAKNIPEGSDFNYVPKEKASGRFVSGEDVTFNTSWGGHGFTSEEIQGLLDGEVIEITAVSKEGKPYKVKGKLGKDKYKGKEFWGFQRIVEFPEGFCGHTFTEDEREKLLTGESVYIEDMWSETKQKNFNATLCYEGGKISFVQEFPEGFGGHTFTEEEKNLLKKGKKVFVSGLWSEAKKKNYDADLVYKDGRIQPVFGKKR